MIIVYVIFALFNLISIFLIIKYSTTKKLNNINFYYILSCMISNLFLLHFFIEFFEPFKWLNYFFFIIVFLCGIYALWKLYKLLLVPTRRAKKWVLPDEEKLAIPIEDKEKSRAIGIYFVSLIFSLISFFIN